MKSRAQYRLEITKPSGMRGAVYPSFGAALEGAYQDIKRFVDQMQIVANGRVLCRAKDLHACFVVERSREELDLYAQALAAREEWDALTRFAIEPLFDALKEKQRDANQEAVMEQQVQNQMMAGDNWTDLATYVCRTCRFYVPKKDELGRCRRHAPTMNGFPVVYPTDWCGDHKLGTHPTQGATEWSSC